MGQRVPRQARSRAKYNAILQAALELFGERGYTETTIDAIVERSGVSVGVFYSYFASKQQLILDLFRQEMEADDDGLFVLPQRLLTLPETEAYIWKILYQRSGLLRARQELLLLDPEFAQHERAYQQRRHERLTWDLEQLRQAGYIREDIRCSTCAWMLLAIVSRLTDMLDEKSEQEMAVEVQAAALMIYHMLHPDIKEEI
ncbi:hypothetical protein KSD_64110 [Ktedonobacter sp. SOSP1-85]|uniref:TetR/AcrR family transcriptional regulator n=1 Tax=Ktedonobacter sp. SOSP1-85 TaxID=2778367 RepID=UPI001915DEC2|nr:TetR/AcrR family transcriptional regulator [Ktedonobacter sp. SOSP1-85]GHO78640.1 hypothetical protein KSD_64110 [Ktedonobacter sp. SOSP1-85]